MRNYWLPYQQVHKLWVLAEADTHKAVYYITRRKYDVWEYIRSDGNWGSLDMGDMLYFAEIEDAQNKLDDMGGPKGKKMDEYYNE